MSDRASESDSDTEAHSYDVLREGGGVDIAPLVIDEPELPEPSVCCALNCDAEIHQLCAGRRI